MLLKVFVTISDLLLCNISITASSPFTNESCQHWQQPQQTFPKCFENFKHMFPELLWGSLIHDFLKEKNELSRNEIPSLFKVSYKGQNKCSSQTDVY